MEEIWKNIKGYSNYMVSNKGNVKSLNYRRTGREKILKPSVDKIGYMFIGLHKNGVQKNYLVHRLVAKAFIQNQSNLPQVNHKDENKQNNCVENLEWCDQKYNNNFATRTERMVEKMSKPILQINKTTNEIIAEYPSLREVERQLGISNSTISKCCNNKLHYNTAGGFKWQYKRRNF